MIKTYKNDIVERMGGEGQSSFNFAVMNFCNMISTDKNLEEFYGSFDQESLHAMITELLDLAFEQHPDYFQLEPAIALRYFRMFELGFNETHFDMLVEHFEVALCDAWIEQEVVDDALFMLRCIRSGFEKKKSSKKSSSSSSKKSESSTAATTPRQAKKKTVGRSKSGEGLLSVFKMKGLKRRKQGIQ